MVDPTYKESEFHHPEHSDAEELRNIKRIHDKILEGGEWWKKVPRRIKRHQSFEPIYEIIEMLIDHKKAEPEGDKARLQQEIKRLENLLEKEREKAKSANDRLSAEQKEKNNQSRKVQSLEKELREKPKENVQGLKDEIDRLKKQLETERGKERVLRG